MLGGGGLDAAGAGEAHDWQTSPRRTRSPERRLPVRWRDRALRHPLPNAEVVLLQIFLITASVPLMAALVEKRRGFRRRPRRMPHGILRFAPLCGTASAPVRLPTGRDAGIIWPPPRSPIATVAMRAPIAPARHRGAANFGAPSQRRDPLDLATGIPIFGARGRPLRLGSVPGRHAAQEAEAEAELLAARLLTLDEEPSALPLSSQLHRATPVGDKPQSRRTWKTHIAAEPATLQLFGEITGSLQETTKEVRTFTYLLNPPHLESDGLRATLQRYADGFSQRTGLKTSLRVSLSTDALPLPLQRSLLRIGDAHQCASPRSGNARLDRSEKHRQANAFARPRRWRPWLRQWPRHRDRQGEWRPARRAAPPGCRHPRNERKNATAWRQTGHPLELRGTTVHAAMPVRSGFCRPSEGLIIARTPVAPHRGWGCRLAQGVDVSAQSCAISSRGFFRCISPTASASPIRAPKAL